MRQSLPNDFPARIGMLRTRLGLTQSELAELLGVSFASVNRWENGQTRPSTLAWQRIVRAETDGLDALAKEPPLQAISEASAQTSEADSSRPPELDFLGNPESVRGCAEGERLGYGHLFNPAFATELSLIDPLPHQRIAVYEHMLSQTRLRFLLADDAGAGKTIMAGLYIREMLSRRLLGRILILPPAGLVGNWEREMRTLFQLSFRIVAGGEARAGNPFLGPDSDRLIVSVDTLAGERMFSRLQDPSVSPYDLVIFDEAHKLSADREPDFRMRRTERYRLAEALAGIRSEEPRWQLEWSAAHLLLLTATPHMGKHFPFYCLWRLLEPEILSTLDAFIAYPADARRRHFLRRTKEEMVRFDGTSIYPIRVSDTLSYDLSPGDAGEQRLYDETTSYIQTFYNRARILNRSAARLAMSIFQRRLASSTYALLRSLERRAIKLDTLIEDLRSGRLDPERLEAAQRNLAEKVHDVLDEKTADEEQAEDGGEEHESAEALALGGVTGFSLAELQAERLQVQGLLELARRVYEAGEESKFEKLREVLRDPQYQDEKILVFTEHRDTLEFLHGRLEGLGFTGKIAQIHGGMPYLAREEQIAFFRKPIRDGGAASLIATDAAGEGINLQFCWRMVNYDIPWNPARLEQRMGRIHRYGQKHEVRIVNLIAGKTREGRVLHTLLGKLESIRRELGSDKVFDVIGRLFEGVSIKEYMAQSLTEEGAEKARKGIEGKLTKGQVEALRAQEKHLLGGGGEVRKELPRLKTDIERETLRRLLPGYVRRFIEKAAPLLDIGIEGDLESTFSLRPLRPGALDPLWPILESYPAEQRGRLTVYRPEEKDEAIFLHPGEPFFDRLRALACSRFAREALRGAIFIDPTASRPYLFHLALVQVVRQGDPGLPTLVREEVLEYRLVGLKQQQDGPLEEASVEYLLLLKGSSNLPPSAVPFASTAEASRSLAGAFAVERIARSMAEVRRQAMLHDLQEREGFLRRGFDYQDAELAAARSRLTDKVRAGDSHAKGELTKIKDRQRRLLDRREAALKVLHREPELIAPGEVTFLVHALVVPSSEPEDRRRHDAEIEAIAVSVARAYEQGVGAEVQDVSTPERARLAGLLDHPGFDLLSKCPGGQERCIEAKGRAGIGDVELTENEWAKACNLRERYWLYVVFDCASPHPRLLRIQDPFLKLIVRAKGSVIINEGEIFQAAEPG